MKSAKKTNSAQVRLEGTCTSFKRLSLKKIHLILLLILASNFGYSQQKNLNINQLQQDLSEVTLSIEKVEQKITHINSRLVGVPTENIDPQLTTRLNDLQIKKNQLEKRKVSIQAALNSAQNVNNLNDIPNLMESDHSSDELKVLNQ